VDTGPTNGGSTSLLALKIRTPVANTGKLRSIGQIPVIYRDENNACYCLINIIARNDRWFAYLHIQNGGSKRIWILTYSWTGNFLLAWAGQFSGIKNKTMHRFEQYLKILQLCHENSRFPPSFKFWSVSTIQKHWEEVKKCILHGFQDLIALFWQSPF
jgi:hypothetical protein